MMLQANVGGRVLLAAVVAVGCENWRTQPDERIADDSGDTVATTTEELNGCGCTRTSVKFYRTTSFRDVKVGPSQNDHVCWAAEYDGLNPVDDPAGWPYLRVGTNNVNWVVSGTGIMACVPRCCFYSNHPSKDVIRLSNEFQVTVNVPAGNRFFSNIADMWGIDSMGLPQGMFHAGALPEEASMDVFQNRPGEYNNRISAEAASDAFHSATLVTYGRSFFVGIPDGSHNVLYHDYQFAGPKIPLMSASLGICVPAEARGFNTGSSSAYLSVWPEADGVWKAESTFNPSTFTPTMRVRCFYYNQNN